MALRPLIGEAVVDAVGKHPRLARLEDMLASARWRTISWRTGTKGKLKARFAAVRVRGLQNTVDMIDGALARSA